MPLDATEQAAPRFGWDATTAGGRTIVVARGELDLASADPFEADLRQELGLGPVLLDLTGITFMDSCGVKLLDAILRAVDAEGWSFAVGSALPDGVKRLFDLTGMTGVIPFADLPEPEEHG